MNNSRRHFLRAASGLVAAAGGTGAARYTAPLAMSLASLAALSTHQAEAADNGYRALVCLYMAGGNDSHNWVVPMDTAGYADYAAVRQDLAWPLSKLLPITSTTQAAGRSFGMPEELRPLRNWYASGRAAILANVGTLTRPTTRSDYRAGRFLPSKLYSHNDQQSTWQSLMPEGAPSGWGGRIGDILMSTNQRPVFTAISTAGNAVFLSGSQVTQYQVGPEGPSSIRAVGTGSLLGSNTARGILQRTVAMGGTNALQTEYARVVQRAVTSDKVLQAALAGTSVPSIPRSLIGSTAADGTLDAEDLAQQLRMVARMISAGQSMGMQRQVFMVQIGGFDTHSNQTVAQPLLMARVAQSVDYFLSALQNMGMLDNVLLFSASDFGRTLTSNGAGSDHGWGSHHFVVGGQVKGGNIYGRMPITALNTDDDVGSGRLLPGTSVTELAATLGSWMGVSATDLAYVLPNLTSFGNRQIGFV